MRPPPRPRTAVPPADPPQPRRAAPGAASKTAASKTAASKAAASTSAAPKAAASKAPAPRPRAKLPRPKSRGAAPKSPGAPAPPQAGAVVRVLPGRGAASRAPAEAMARATAAASVTERLAERAAARRHLLHSRILAATITALVAAAAGWVILFSPLLAVRADAVSVTGAGTGTYVDAAAVQAVLAGTTGVPLARVDAAGLRDRLREVRGVRDAEVRRAWPRGLRIVVSPRLPVAAVPDGGRVALLDAEAVRVATQATAPKGLPVVDVPLGERTERPLRSVIAILAALPADLRAQVDEVGAQTQDSVRMRMRDGSQVLWGSDDDLALKVRVLVALRAAPGHEQVRVYDVSAPSAPVTRT